jgi:hypothetical protein
MHEAWAFLMDPANLPFAVSLALMLLIGVIEATGLFSSAIDLHIDHDGGAAWLGWLGLGKVPLLVVLVVFLALFGLSGLVIQQLAFTITGSPLSVLLASGTAVLTALPLTGIAARGLSRILPRDETTAVPLEALVGRIGTITLGEASQGSPARLRVEDRHGQAHYVMVEPDNSGEIFREGESVLLVDRQAELFRGISYDNPLLTRLEL